MSYLAVGSVTKSIAELLARKLNKPELMGAGASFRVTALPPDDDRVSAETGINLFLYRIHENPFTRNMDWRGDKVNPVRSSKPPLSLTLNYLVTAYAKTTDGTAQDDITAHQVMGNAMAVLNDYPVLNDVHDSDFDASLDTQFAPELRNAFDKIKLSLLPTTMEEFSKIWTGLNKAYRLSVAYEISLVEIGPTTPVALPAPAVQVAALQLGTRGAPQIVSVTPSLGMAGATVTIKGSRLQQAGASTTVQVGDDLLTEDQLLSIRDNEIQFVTSVAPQAGPRLAIVVSTGGRQSQTGFYTVTPWLKSVVPLRGIAGIPVTISIVLPAAALVQVDIGGVAATFTLDPSGKSVTAVIPSAVTSNGPVPVVVTVNGQRSNALIFEVLPLITSVTVTTTANPVSTTLTIAGERLNGTLVYGTVAGLSIGAGSNLNPAQLVLTVQRTLQSTAPVTVTVDGSESNPIPAQLTVITPASVSAGDSILLSGAGLSGRAVNVSFGAVAVDLGAQPFGSRIRVATPRSLAAGVIPVSLSVDGRATNSLPLAVLE